MHQVEGVEQLGRHRPVDAAPALLEALKDDHPAGQVNPVGGQRQGFGDPAASGLQHAAKERTSREARATAWRKARRSLSVK